MPIGRRFIDDLTSEQFNGLIGLPIVSNRSAPPGSIFVLEDRIVRSAKNDDSWTPRPVFMEDPRWMEWLRGWTNTPLLWEGDS